MCRPAFVSEGLCSAWHACICVRIVSPSKRALELDPKYSKAWFRMGKAYDGLKDYDNAISALQTALELSHADPAMKATIHTQLQATRSAV